MQVGRALLATEGMSEIAGLTKAPNESVAMITAYHWVYPALLGRLEAAGLEPTDDEGVPAAFTTDEAPFQGFLEISRRTGMLGHLLRVAFSYAGGVESSIRRPHISGSSCVFTQDIGVMCLAPIHVEGDEIESRANRHEPMDPPNSRPGPDETAFRTPTNAVCDAGHWRSS